VLREMTSALPPIETLIHQLQEKGFEVPDRAIKIGSFGDSPALSDKLLQLIRDGVKTAAASLVWEWEDEQQTLPEAGDVMIVLDWNQNPVMVIEYLDVSVKPFLEIDSQFAWDEGEGDRSLEFWRTVHWAFFTRACAELGVVPSEAMPILCTRFRVQFDSISAPEM